MRRHHYGPAGPPNGALSMDPSTILLHLRILEASGFVVALPVVQGRSGAYEKPHQSTDLSWQLIIDDDEVAEFVGRVRAVIDEFVESNANHSQRSAPRYGVLFATHRLAEHRQPQ
jgi:DNA-binding transcriptional ArsR family regulator